MEESKALQRLAEAADLVGMIEDMLSPQSIERLSGSGWSGMRITLRNIRDMIHASHGTLAGDLVQRSRASLPTNGAAGAHSNDHASSPQSSERHRSSEATITRSQSSIGSSDMRPALGPMTRKDLKASLEKFIER